MHFETFTHGSHLFNYTNHPMVLPNSAVTSMRESLQTWQKVFPYERSYVQTTYNVPSIIVRFDGSLDDDGVFHAYEIQDGSGWVGYAGIVNPDLKVIRQVLVQQKWPPFKLLLTPSLEHDDTLWLERISLDEALGSEVLLQLRYYFSRGLLTRDDALNLTARSMIPFRAHNNKLYGIEMGWWKEVRWDAATKADALSWEKPFVLKPAKSWGSRSVMFWNPDERGGRSTQTQITRTLEKFGAMYLQEFIPPMKVAIGGHALNVIFRAFFAYDPTSKSWVPWGGVWSGRPYPNLRIHGASDTISGPLVLES